MDVERRKEFGNWSKSVKRGTVVNKSDGGSLGVNRIRFTRFFLISVTCRWDLGSEGTRKT